MRRLSAPSALSSAGPAPPSSPTTWAGPGPSPAPASPSSSAGPSSPSAGRSPCSSSGASSPASASGWRWQSSECTLARFRPRTAGAPSSPRTSSPSTRGSSWSVPPRPAAHSYPPQTRLKSFGQSLPRSPLPLRLRRLIGVRPGPPFLRPRLARPRRPRPRPRRDALRRLLLPPREPPLARLQGPHGRRGAPASAPRTFGASLPPPLERACPQTLTLPPPLHIAFASQAAALRTLRGKEDVSEELKGIEARCCARRLFRTNPRRCDFCRGAESGPRPPAAPHRTPSPRPTRSRPRR